MAPYYKQPLLICEPNIEPVPHYLEGVDYNNSKIIAERVNYDPTWIKLQLKPLSAITDEDAIEVAKMEGFVFYHIFRSNVSPFVLQIKNEKNRFLSIAENWENCHSDSDDGESGYMLNTNVYQYLQSKGYDLPQYLLGGKTLHESGLAIYEPKSEDKE